jgi:predicted nucleic acid-binding protein
MHRHLGRVHPLVIGWWNGLVVLLELLSIEHRTVRTPEINATALELAIRHQHNSFDRSYHAVALRTPRAALVPADCRYCDKAKTQGRIVLLSDCTSTS